MARDLRLLIDPRLVWFVELDGEPVAFGVCLPNVNEAIRDLGGRLLPFGWAKLLWRLKVRRPRTARVPLMGVRRKLSGTTLGRSAEHTSDIQSLMRILSAGLGFKKKKIQK